MSYSVQQISDDHGTSRDDCARCDGVRVLDCPRWRGPIAAERCLAAQREGCACACKASAETVAEARGETRGAQAHIRREGARTATHCKRGHEWTPSTTGIRLGKYRICLTCKRQDYAISNARARARRGAP